MESMLAERRRSGRANGTADTTITANAIRVACQPTWRLTDFGGAKPKHKVEEDDTKPMPAAQYTWKQLYFKLQPDLRTCRRRAARNIVMYMTSCSCAETAVNTQKLDPTSSSMKRVQRNVMKIV
jgi:hypothetical protein